MPRCGAISTAPETGTTCTSLPAAAKKRAGEVRKDRRDARRAPNVVQRTDAALLARGDDQPAAAELEIEARFERASGFGDEVPAGDAGIRGAVGDELGNVLRAHEDGLELAAERRGEGALAAGPYLEAGVVEQIPAVLVQPAFVGKCDSEHGVWIG